MDAALWFFEAVRQYFAATQDTATLRELFPVMAQMISAHLAGTRYQIHVDESDGLLYAGEPGVQLTWMDAKVGDWVVTPRIGKPVEINALWFNALQTMASPGSGGQKIRRPLRQTRRASETKLRQILERRRGMLLRRHRLTRNRKRRLAPPQSDFCRFTAAQPAYSRATKARRGFLRQAPRHFRWDCAVSRKANLATRATTEAASANATAPITRARCGDGCSAHSFWPTFASTAIAPQPSASLSRWASKSSRMD